MEKDIFQEMDERWSSPVVARTEVERFTGGLMSGKYMANLDSQGAGPARVVCGRKVAYILKGENGLVAWLRARSSK